MHPLYSIVSSGVIYSDVKAINSSLVENKNKTRLLDNLDFLLTHNIYGEGQYRNRFNGFVAELHFADMMKQTRIKPPLAGGMFVPLEQGRDPFASSVYYTVSSDIPSMYADIYKDAAKLASEGLYFIRYKNQQIESWPLQKLSFATSKENTVAELICPELEFFKYDKTGDEFKKSAIEEFQSTFHYHTDHLKKKKVSDTIRNAASARLKEFTIDSLIELYVNRFVFDGLSGFNITRGASLDIDAFVYNPENHSLRILEVKEKDRSRGQKGGFGMDVRRIKSLEILEKNFNMRCVYLVRKISDQKKRDFLEWKYIFMDRFREKTDPDKTIQGGFGMGFEDGDYPTLVCPEENYTRLPT